MSKNLPCLRNEQAISLKEIPVLKDIDFINELITGMSEGLRVITYFGDRINQTKVILYAVMADDRDGLLYPVSLPVNSGSFPSLAGRFPQVQLFEREIHEQTGLVPEGHPWLKPVRFTSSSISDSFPVPPKLIGDADFFRIEGKEIHEVAVGPVHAGIIEPGHFRFQCHGENVYHLEISLGYQHRGIEKALIGGPYPVTPLQMEAVAGDTSIGHMTAYCQIIETLTKSNITALSGQIRAIALELERCANHTGDLGALAGDVGFLPTSSYCGRIRGDFLNLTAVICGNRFGRGLVIPGGTGFGINKKQSSELISKIGKALDDFTSALNLMWDSPSTVNRFDSTGRISEKLAMNLGLVGPVARASGCIKDVRQDHPDGYYRFAQIPVCTYDTGDVFGRAQVRWQEVQASVEFIMQQLESEQNSRLSGKPFDTNKQLKSGALAISLVEGWRGEICHTAITDANGHFRRYKIVDPSFHNWFGLAQALREEQISDFPLCNKSFNLSYCGHDL